MNYTRANTDWFSGSFGVSAHWTSKTAPLASPALPFRKAVAAFDLDGFIAQARQAGARHLIFTTTHAEQRIAGPNPVLDDLLPGRTCRRDLLGELVESATAAGIRVIFYYNHSCNRGDDPAWENASAYLDGPAQLFGAHIIGIVEHMSRRYGRRLSGWWFDSSYSVSDANRFSTVTTRVPAAEWSYPWEGVCAAAKSGNPDSLVTFNAGVDSPFLYTPFQDYFWGETTHLRNKPAGRYTPEGLQAHQWTCIDNREWVHAKPDTPFHAPLYTDDELGAYVRAHTAAGGAVTFNIEISQPGQFNPACIDQLARLRL